MYSATSLVSFTLYLCKNKLLTVNGAKKGLLEKLSAGECILCAEGYLLALCQRGYITHGVFVPEFILEQPEVLRAVHYEFIHAGSDVVEAFQVCVRATISIC